MATIKSYSDLQQSKKLAEILPLESADMYYEEVCNLPKVIVGNYILHNQCMEDKDYKKLSNPVLSPAWSLAVLLDVLPVLERRGYQKAKPRLLYNMNINKWIVDSHVYTTDAYDNPVDACVDMIIRLSENELI